MERTIRTQKTKNLPPTTFDGEKVALPSTKGIKRRREIGSQGIFKKGKKLVFNLDEKANTRIII